MEIYYWQNIPSMHQVPCQRALAALGHQVHLCVESLMLDERLKMGWKPENTEGLTVRAGMNWPDSRRTMLSSSPQSVHIISGVHGVRFGALLTRLAHATGRRACWMLEAWDPRPWKGYARQALYSAEALYFRPKLWRLFAMGEMGFNTYRSVGYDESQLRTTRYVVPLKPRPPGSYPTTRENFVFGYLGLLIERKGVDVLLRALAGLQASERPWQLQIHGDGPERGRLEALARELGIRDRVSFCGRYPADTVQDRLEQIDALVLPSRFDGWGACVNEALLCGVPAIVSDRCGSSTLLRDGRWGSIFRSEDHHDLGAKLAAFLQKRPSLDTAAIYTAIGPDATAQELVRDLQG